MNEGNLIQQLHQAIEEGNVAAAKAAISQGADVRAVNQAGSSPLQEAAWRGDTKMVALLLKNGANADGIDQKPRPQVLKM